MSLPRSAGRESSHTSPSHQAMSPRLPRKTRHASYSSTGKLDTALGLQADQYAAAASAEEIISPIHTASPNSPYTSRPHRKDRYGSLDFRQHQSHEQRSRDKFGSLDRTAAMNRYGYREQRERSLERTIDYSGKIQRNRSLDRDYPLVSVSNRTLVGEMEADSEVDIRYQQSQSSMLILSLQTQLVDLNKDYTITQRELEQNKSQLNSYIASVKTFWSPELKKERGLRKEEVQKGQKLQEMTNKLQHECQVLQVKLQNVEERLSLQGIKDSQSPDGGALTALTRESDRQEKEIAILQNTISEMELRIDLQKKTLSARDASIKKLVEMLQTKNIPIETILNGEAEKDKLRHEIATLERNLLATQTATQSHENQTSKLNQTIQQLQTELSEAQSNVSRANRESKNLDEVQGLLDMKTNRISELEEELKEFEQQIACIRASSAKSENEEKRQIEAIHSHESVLKSKLENLRLELSSKNTELLSLQSKVDTLQSQRNDTEQHVEIMKQQMVTKENSLDLLKKELTELQSVVKDRDANLSKRNSQLETMKTDKMKLESDLADSKYEAEVTLRKLNLMQKKLENGEEQVKERTEEISSLESRISALSAKSSQNEALEQLQKTVDEKNKLVEKLKEQRDKAMEDRQEEVNNLQKSNKDLTCELEKLKQIIEEKHNELLELKETASELRSEKLKIDSLLNGMEKKLSDEISRNETLTSQITQLRNESNSQTDHASEKQHQVEELTKQVSVQSEELQKYQKEIDRLLHILKEMENEKHDKDKQIREIQEQLKEAKIKYVNLRKNQQQAEKKRSEENHNNGTVESGALNDQVVKYKDRVEELEEALKQSVRITAKCEVVVSQQKKQIDKKDQQIKGMEDEVKKAMELSGHVNDLEESLKEKNGQLRKLVSERSRHMEEAYEMKQEAILAAISEKDSHIALLEASKPKRAEEIEKLGTEKQRLNLRLKDLTTQRMLLVVEQSSDNSKMLAEQSQSQSDG